MRIDIMTDIETLGTNSDSTIFQISAVAFDIHNGEHIKKFNVIADLAQNKAPLKVDGRTLKWWLNEDKELLSDLLHSGTVSGEDMLDQFYNWIKEVQHQYGNKNVYLWGNGILFDNKMLQHQLNNQGLDYPIFYRNDRDVRTILELAAEKLGESEAELKAKFNDDSLIKHNAYDDVTYQINLVVACYRELIY